MINETEKKDLASRLKKIEGQIRGIFKMVDDRRYCIDILSQTRAAAAAIAKVENIIMKSHLETCVTESMRSDNREDRENKIEEIMDMLSKFRKIG